MYDPVKIAAKLRSGAEAVQKEIDRLRAPRSTNTRKRQREWESAMSEARRLEVLADKLSALAEGYATGRLPEALHVIKWGVFGRSNLETILRSETQPYTGGDLPLMSRIGLGDPADYAAARAAIMAIGDPEAGTIRPAEAIQRLEIECDNSRIQGYFPTPHDLALRLVGYIVIRPQAKILEPSAGKGSIADVIRENYPEALIDVCEWNYSLREILKLKGYNVVGDDVFELPKTQGYDAILMNPPFQSGADIKHIQFCYEHLLAPGGELGAIVSESPFFRDDKTSKQFREWFSANNGAFVEKNANAFKDGDRSTGVATRIIHMCKEAVEEVQPEPAPYRDLQPGDTVTTGTGRLATVVKNNGLVYCDDGSGLRPHKANTLTFVPKDKILPVVETLDTPAAIVEVILHEGERSIEIMRELKANLSKSTAPVHESDNYDDGEALEHRLKLEDAAQALSGRQRRILMALHFGQPIERRDMAIAFVMEQNALLNVVDRSNGRGDLTDFGIELATFLAKDSAGADEQD